MKFLPFTRLGKIVVIVGLTILVAGIGYRLGEYRTRVTVSPSPRILINTEPPEGISVDFRLFWDVWQKVTEYYIDRASINVQEMVWGGIRGMVSALGDPYTSFLPPKENEEFKEDLGGEFEGIGAQLGLKDERIVVIAPLVGTPAQKAGLLAGDYILKVNEEETVGWTIPQAVSKIRGPKGTTVELEVLHENSQTPQTLAIVRGTISVPSVEWWVKPPAEISEIQAVAAARPFLANAKKIVYLRLSRFGDNTNRDWLKAVDEILSLQRANGTLAGMILDLRNNPGGYLDGSVFIASEFLTDGIVVSQVNSDGTREDFEVNRKGKLLTIPLVVLVNQGSASASEIVAGALADHGRATTVGEKTFGKGSVQTPFELSGGAGVHITTGKWLLPKGTSIHKEGITPDVVVEMDTPEASGDAQLAKAVELLLE